MANDNPDVPVTPDVAVPDVAVVAPGGGKRGGSPGLDPTTAGQLIGTTIERAPLVQQGTEIESGRQADIGKVLADSSERAGAGYDAAQGNLEAAANKYSEHNDLIWNKLNSMSPLMTRDQYWNSKTTGEKILAGVGLFLGGVSGSDAMQKAIDKDFEIDRAQHEQDFKKYAAMHGIDNVEVNQAKYMNLARNMYVANGLKLAQQDIAAITAKSNSEQVKVNGAQAIIDLKDRIEQLSQVGRDSARSVAAAQQARMDKLRSEINTRADAAAKIEVESTKEGDNPVLYDDAFARVRDNLVKNDPYLQKVGEAYPNSGILSANGLKDLSANRAIENDLKAFKANHNRAPNNFEYQTILEDRLGKLQPDGKTFGDPGKNQWSQNKDGKFEFARPVAVNTGVPGISNTARKEGRVVQVPDVDGQGNVRKDANGNTVMVERVATNSDSVKRIEEFGDAGRKAGVELRVFRDPNSSIEAKRIAFDNLKALVPKMLTGTSRVQGGQESLLQSVLSTVKAEDLAANPKLVDQIINQINTGYRDTLNYGVRGGWKGAIPDLIQVPSIVKPVSPVGLGDNSGTLPPGAAGYNPGGRPGEGVAPVPKTSFANKYGVK